MEYACFVDPTSGNFEGFFGEMPRDSEHVIIMVIVSGIRRSPQQPPCVGIELLADVVPTNKLDEYRIGKWKTY